VSCCFFWKACALAISCAVGCLQVGKSFFNAPRVMFVYCISPFGMMWSGWPTMQLAVSEVSRTLQPSMNMRSPLHV
jgi:hypothetical protein